MSEPIPNPSAFPVVIPTDNIWQADAGMTLRDYFAAAALQAVLASGYKNHEACKEAYWYADQMLWQRRPEGENP